MTQYTKVYKVLRPDLSSAVVVGKASVQYGIGLEARPPKWLGTPLTAFDNLADARRFCIDLSYQPGMRIFEADAVESLARPEFLVYCDLQHGIKTHGFGFDWPIGTVFCDVIIPRREVNVRPNSIPGFADI